MVVEWKGDSWRSWGVEESAIWFFSESLLHEGLKTVQHTSAVNIAAFQCNQPSAYRSFCLPVIEPSDSDQKPEKGVQIVNFGDAPALTIQCIQLHFFLRFQAVVVLGHINDWDCIIPPRSYVCTKLKRRRVLLQASQWLVNIGLLLYCHCDLSECWASSSCGEVSMTSQSYFMITWHNYVCLHNFKHIDYRWLEFTSQRMKQPCTQRWQYSIWGFACAVVTSSAPCALDKSRINSQHRLLPYSCMSCREKDDTSSGTLPSEHPKTSSAPPRSMPSCADSVWAAYLTYCYAVI